MKMLLLGVAMIGVGGCAALWVKGSRNPNEPFLLRAARGSPFLFGIWASVALAMWASSLPD